MEHNVFYNYYIEPKQQKMSSINPFICSPSCQHHILQTAGWSGPSEPSQMWAELPMKIVRH